MPLIALENERTERSLRSIAEWAPPEEDDAPQESETTPRRRDVTVTVAPDLHHGGRRHCRAGSCSSSGAIDKVHRVTTHR